jgi:sensor histidine kinase YesM
MNNNLRKLIQSFLIGVVIFLILSLYEYLSNGWRPSSGTEILKQFGFNQLYAVGLYMANDTVINYLIRTYGADLFKFKNLFKGVLAGIVATISTMFLIRIFIGCIVFGRSLSEFISSEHYSYYTVGFTISVIISSIFYFLYYYKNKQDNRLKEQKIIAGVASAQFDALKNQLDPHFLFNSLNVLTSLIEENPVAATKFTTALSKVYRYVLEQKNKELVTIEEELKFAHLYISLLKMRFEDSIVFTSPETLMNPEGKVVPLALQLLLENAVKHNQVTPTKKLYITVTESKGVLTVTNNLQTKQTLKESSGVGLRNIKQRYAILTSERVTIEHTDETFKISIPIITQDIKIMKTQDTYISEKRYENAQEQVKKLKGFYAHLTIYLLFIPLFIYLNFQSNAGFPWAVFPIFGWGFGVAGHASETYDWNPFFSKNWEQRKIKELIDKEDE